VVPTTLKPYLDSGVKYLTLFLLSKVSRIYTA
jgi:hypothetical protein